MSNPHAALLFVLLLLPGTTLSDWQNANAPHLHLLMRAGCMALMNARTAEQDRITPAAGINTLMAGARMEASPSAKGLSYPARADNLPAGLAEAGVQVDLSALTDSTSTLIPQPLSPVDGPHPAPSAADRPHPPAPSPKIGRGGEARGSSPTILPTGQQKQARIIVIDLGGDPAKADAEIGRWAQAANREHGAIMVVSSNPSAAEYRAGDQLTPVLVYGHDIPQGLLWSRSTHQAGLATNTDIAPTIADYFHARLPVPSFGAPLTEADVTSEDVPEYLSREDTLWQAQARDLRALPYLAGFLAVLIAGATALAYRERPGWGVAVLFAAAVPLTLLMSASLPIFASLSISALGGAFALRRRPWEGLAWIGAATALLVVGDALFDAGRMTGRSLLGYSPLEGARYYGVGNEAMGALIGAGVVLTGAMARFFRGKEWPVVLWLVVAFALGWPGAGAKAGGFLVALIALAAYVWLWSGRKLTAASFWLALAGCIAACGTLLAVVGSLFGHTHFGQAVHLMRSEGPAVVASLAERKAAMDLHLIFHSVWMLTLAAAGIGATVLYRKKGITAGGGEIAAQVGLLAGLGCLLLNDAGVVAAAICSVYVWAYCASAPAGIHQPAPSARIGEERVATG